MNRHILKAGKSLMRFFRVDDLEIQEKSKNNPVTEADFAANEILVSAIRERFPEDAILSEEESPVYTLSTLKERKAASRLWVIDPLDGTKEFIRGVPQFSVSVALIEDDRAVFGWVYNPAQESFFYGGKHFGFYENQIKRFDDPAELESSPPRAALSKTETSNNLFDFLLDDPSFPEPMLIGSIAWKLALLAAGKVDLVVSRKPKNDWDVAGGMALLEVRDKIFLDKEFRPLRFNRDSTLLNGVVAGSAEAIKNFRRLLEKKGIQL